jgi:hypothetical protein
MLLGRRKLGTLSGKDMLKRRKSLKKSLGRPQKPMKDSDLSPSRGLSQFRLQTSKKVSIWAKADSLIFSMKCKI